MRKTLVALGAGLLAALTILPHASAKKVLGHTDFDSWKRAKNYSLSRNGQWAAFAEVPQEGDATLFLYNTRTKKRITVERGYDPEFTADSKFAVMLVKPLFSQTRQAKIDGKKGDDLPTDTLALVDLGSGRVEKIPHVTGFKIGKDGGTWVAYKSADTLYIKPKDLKDKKSGSPLVIRNLGGPQQKIVKWADKYVFSKDGSKIALTIKKPEKDTLATDGLGLIQLPDTSFYIIDRDKPFYGIPVFNETGTQLAYTASTDSTETGTRRASLYTAMIGNGLIEAQEITVECHSGTPVNLALPHAADPEVQARLEQERTEAIKRSMGLSMYINQYSIPLFSHNGKRLVIGVAPEVAPDDTTIVDFERADLDIWRWDSPYTPPQELKLAEKLRSRTYPVVINLSTGHQQLIYRNSLAEVTPPDRWDGTWAMLSDPSSTIISRQWNYLPQEELWTVNVDNGDMRKVTEASREEYVLSPGGRFIAWFKDKQYYAYDNQTGKQSIISSKVAYPLWDIDDDHPMGPTSVGIAGWSKDDRAMLVYDKYDIWSLDPTGEKDPVCLTREEGRKSNCRFRYLNLDEERRYLSDGDLMILEVFDYTTKQRGMATMRYGAPSRPEVRVMDKASFTQIRKAKNADTFTWQRASFEIGPDIWLSNGLNFNKAQCISNTNPQMADYSWGTAHLFKWYAYNGKPAEGVLYLPEDFDPSKEYPMLAVFYEKAAEDLYTHYTMEPSWSWVNYPFYVSRGYVVFVPDIHYTTGIPGECAYNYVCSGVEAVCDAYPNIDRKRIGIDGQSWGGYQTAYLITRTNMFACAGSGAPVSNMTSAFGGIRWGTGDSRQAQYEMGQSRIGRNLWEAPELYIANSPVFHADRVTTPLLIMHNDADGAVPWYQGIEYFMALRRLGKPVWMLQYNDEAHNIRERRNRKDITIRLQQFFDHYLKGDPMPKWMKEGIPAIRKGQEMGY